MMFGTREKSVHESKCWKWYKNLENSFKKCSSDLCINNMTSLCTLNNGASLKTSGTLLLLTLSSQNRVLISGTKINLQVTLQQFFLMTQRSKIDKFPCKSSSSSLKLNSSNLARSMSSSCLCLLILPCHSS